MKISASEGASLLGALLAGKLPDGDGRFGPFGGRFAPETLMPALSRLENAAQAFFADSEACEALDRERRQWIGRPTPLTRAHGLEKSWGAREVWLKREDLAHTGAHKINNALGQAHLALKLGASRVVAETGAGQHGVAAAAACARAGLPCSVYMGVLDMQRQAPNVQRMHQLGAEVVAVDKGDRTLRAATDEAFRTWVADPEGVYYLLGSAVGPHPYPWLVRELQRVIGDEAREQWARQATGMPDAVFACVGGGSNAIGLFHGFLGEDSVRIFGVEAGGKGLGPGENAASLSAGRPGVLHGSYSMLLYDGDGQVLETASISAGLDYPGVGPEHALLQAIGRVDYVTANDAEALDGLSECCRLEGILPALEPAHAFFAARRWTAENPGKRILIGLSGRGDKDMPTLTAAL